MTTIQSSNLLAQRLNSDNKTTVSVPKAGTINNEEATKQTPPTPPSLALLGLSIAIPLLSFPAINFITKRLMKSDKALGIDFNNVKKTLDNMLKEEKLSEKGVTANFWAEGTEDAKYLFKNHAGGAYMFDKASGKKTIETMTERASLSLHEAGHAVNQECSKIGKLYARIIEKTPRFFGGPIGLAIWSGLAIQLIGQGYNKPKKVNGQQEAENHPILKFIHNNMGKLTFLAFVPVLLDEVFATSRALKATKKVSPEILKPLKRNLLFAGATYLLVAGGNVISTLLNRKYADRAKAVRDAQ